jgi:glutaredoxin-related protein
MSYLELKHTADSVSYIDSLERNHKKNQSTEISGIAMNFENFIFLKMQNI